MPGDNRAAAMTPEEARRWLGLGLGVLSVIGVLALLLALWVTRLDPVLTNIVTKNFQVIIGLPAAAIVAFIVLVFFRQSETPMTIKVPGIELSGSSGEVLLWLAVFAVVATVIHWLWVPLS